MIPGKENTLEGAIVNAPKEKIGSFIFFDVENFIRRIIRYWYWFVIMAVIGYFIAWVYNKYLSLIHI